MNLVDSSGWLEYFTGGPKAAAYESPLLNSQTLIVPSICIFEVFKKVLSERGEDNALQTAIIMQQAQVIDLNIPIALQAAKIGHELNLPLADSIVLATARIYKAVLWTQDKHFKGLPGIKFILNK